MSSPSETHYDLLGVRRDAKTGEIRRAYDRFTAEMALDTTPPDARRALKMKEAYEVLVDEARRDEYDRTLTLARTVKAKPRPALALAAGALVLLAAGYFVLKPAPPPERLVKKDTEIQFDATRALARVRALDISGRAIPAGLAFTVEPGVMLTACELVPPGTQLVVTIGKREAPARHSAVDEASGLCKIAVEGGGSWPVPIASSGPRAGDKAYAASLSAGGEAVLVETSVKRVYADARGKAIETVPPAKPGSAGAPLLDVLGRVIGISALETTNIPGRFVAVSPNLVIEKAPEAAAPAIPPPVTAEPVPEKVDPLEAMTTPRPQKLPPGITEQQRDEMAKRFRPPPNVPKDL